MVNRLGKTIVRIGWVLCLIMPLLSCGESGRLEEGIEGTVLNKKTGQPIPGAIVIARWRGSISMVVDSQTVCYHVETMTSDAEGRYNFPSWRYEGDVKITDRAVFTDAYKPGYRDYRKVGEYMPKDMIYLVPFEGTKEERLEYLLSVFGITGCGAADDSGQNTLPILKALYAEAKSLQITQEHARNVEYILYGLEKIELGYEEAQRRHLERVMDK